MLYFIPGILSVICYAWNLAPFTVVSVHKKQKIFFNPDANAVAANYIPYHLSAVHPVPLASVHY